MLVAACGSSSKHTGTGSSGSSGSSGASVGSAKQLVGAGSTLVAPIMSQWQPTYDSSDGVAVTYGAIGSGGGIESITGRTVNFQSIDIWRVEDGLLAEHWDQLNMDHLFRQLGVDPATAVQS